MKILFDQNISHRVLKLVEKAFPDARHVRDFNHQFSTDRQIWNFAKQEGFALLTFDADFNDLALLNGIPPKIIWLRVGNTLTKNLADVLNNREEQILAFLTDSTFAETICLEIDY